MGLQQSERGISVDYLWAKLSEVTGWPDEWKGTAAKAIYAALDDLGWGRRKKKGRHQRMHVFGLELKCSTNTVAPTFSSGDNESDNTICNVVPIDGNSECTSDVTCAPASEETSMEANESSTIIIDDNNTGINTSTEDQSTPQAVQRMSNAMLFNTCFYNKLTAVGLNLNANNWKLKDLKQKLRPAHIKSTSLIQLEHAAKDNFADYLDIILPRTQESTPEHLKAGYLRATRSIKFKSNEMNQIRAWLCTLFPPISVEDKGLTFTLPQFCHSESNKPGSFACLICCEYERQSSSKLRHDKKIFEGCKQVIQHGKSNYHRDAFNFMTGLVTRHSPCRPNVQPQATLWSFFGRKTPHRNTPCLHVRDRNILEAFRDKQTIHKMSYQKVFELKTEFHCSKHKECAHYSVWKVTHPEEDQKLRKLNVTKAELVHMNEEVITNGHLIKITEAIKSVHPPCNGAAVSTLTTGPFAYMCANCKSTHHYLQNLLLKKKSAALDEGSRLFAPGMREDALSITELTEKRAQQKQTTLKLIGTNKTLIRKTNGGEVDLWTQELIRASASDDMKQFIMDCMDLFRRPVNDGNFVQLEVIKNLVGKLQRGRNHHYCDLIKKIASMHMNFLGSQNYTLMKVYYVFI